MSNVISDADFSELLSACQEISALFPEGVIFIGGIAVYLHTVNTENTRTLAESTHDADFYISIADMSDLRDIEEVTPNRRLSKHQLIKRGFEFDIYTERHSALIIPYDQVSAHGVKYDSVKVAAVEHLFLLKLEAYRDRHASAKGGKDAKDLIRLSIVSRSQRRKFKFELIEGYLSDEHITLLQRIQRSPEMLALAKGNAKLAKKYREDFSTIASDLIKRYRKM